MPFTAGTRHLQGGVCDNTPCPLPRAAAAARRSRKAEPGGRGGDYLPRMPFGARGPGRSPAAFPAFPAFSAFPRSRQRSAASAFPLFGTSPARQGQALWPLGFRPGRRGVCRSFFKAGLVGVSGPSFCVRAVFPAGCKEKRIDKRGERWETFSPLVQAWFLGAAQAARSSMLWAPTILYYYRTTHGQDF